MSSKQILKPFSWSSRNPAEKVFTPTYPLYTWVILSLSAIWTSWILLPSIRPTEISEISGQHFKNKHLHRHHSYVQHCAIRPQLLKHTFRFCSDVALFSFRLKRLARTMEWALNGTSSCRLSAQHRLMICGGWVARSVVKLKPFTDNMQYAGKGWELLGTAVCCTLFSDRFADYRHACRNSVLEALAVDNCRSKLIILRLPWTNIQGHTGPC